MMTRSEPFPMPPFSAWGLVKDGFTATVESGDDGVMHVTIHNPVGELVDESTFRRNAFHEARLMLQAAMSTEEE